MGLCGESACVCDLSLSFFLISLHSGGSNVRHFFYTWPCLCGRTYQRRLVGASLSTCLIQSGQKCLQTSLKFFFSFLLCLSLFSLSLSWPAWMDCTSPLLLVFHSIYFFCKRHPCIATTSFVLWFVFWSPWPLFWDSSAFFMSVYLHQCLRHSYVRFVKWNKMKSSRHLLRGEIGQKGRTDRGKGSERTREVPKGARGRNWV